MSNNGIGSKVQSSVQPGVAPTRKWFQLGWLALGSLQLLVSAGCGQSMAADPLLSSDAPEAQQGAAPSERAPAAGQGFVMPVRVSRAFFESGLEGAVRLQSRAQGEGAALESAVSWQELATTEAPPAPTAATGPVLADFRDHEGCASFKGMDGVSLCFKLMGDVSNVGLNEREMQADRLDEWVNRELGAPCEGGSWKTRLQDVSREGGNPGVATSFTVKYVAEPVGGAECEAAPAQIDLTLRRI